MVRYQDNRSIVGGVADVVDVEV